MPNILYKKILVVRIGNIGDVLFVTPLIRRVHTQFPKSQLDVLTSPQARVVLDRSPNISNVFIYRKFHKISRWLKRKLLLQRLRRRGYDLCIVLESNREYLKFSSDACPKALRIGIASAHSKEYLVKEVNFLRTRHAIENYLALLQLLGIAVTKDDQSMDFFIEGGEPEREQYAIVHPNCTKCLPYRGWPIERFEQIVRYFLNRGLLVYITGSASDIESKRLLSLFEGTAGVKPFIGKDLPEVAKLIKNSKIVVCCDTGIMHLTQALHGKLVALFGPSDPRHTGPIGPGTFRIIRKPFDCGPCNYYPEYHKEQKAQCMIESFTKCMRAVEVKDVVAAIEEISEI